jgi:hypothetical protein
MQQNSRHEEKPSGPLMDGGAFSGRLFKVEAWKESRNKEEASRKPGSFLGFHLFGSKSVYQDFGLTSYIIFGFRIRSWC